MTAAASAAPGSSTNGRFMEPDAPEPAREVPELSFRPITPEDAPALQDAFEHLSPLSRYYRFHAGMAHLSDDLLYKLTHVDGVNHVALVAFERDAGQEEGVGVGRFVRLPDAPANAELAVTVIDRAQGHGVARRLISALAPLARERGISTFTLNVLADNSRARRMAKQLGAVAQGSSGGVIAFQLPVDAAAGTAVPANDVEARDANEAA